MTPLGRAVLRTLCFADAMDMALTPVEIHRFLGIDLGARATLAEVTDALVADEDVVSRTATRSGLVALAGHGALIAERLERMAVAEEKWRVAGRALRRIRHVPWVQLAAVCNTVAMGNPRRESDIDLFLVAAPGRLWIVRLLTHAALLFGGLARRGSDARDRMCLSFSITTNTLGLQSIAKPPADPYLAVWLATLAPVLDRDDTYRRFLGKNAWAAAVMPDAAPRSLAPRFALAPSRLARTAEAALPGRLGDAAERVARRLQRPRILMNAQSRVHFGGTDVVVSDDMLKFHEEDKRDAIRDAFLARCARYGV